MDPFFNSWQSRKDADLASEAEKRRNFDLKRIWLDHIARTTLNVELDPNRIKVAVSPMVQPITHREPESSQREPESSQRKAA